MGCVVREHCLHLRVVGMHVRVLCAKVAPLEAVDRTQIALFSVGQACTQRVNHVRVRACKLLFRVWGFPERREY